MKNLYSTLRWAENVKDGEAILIFDIAHFTAIYEYPKDNEVGAEHKEALISRVARATEDRLI